MISLLKIQKWMEENNKDVLLINRTDEFLSEYIAPYAERLQWLTKFSGSAGRAIIEKNKAYIYVDGRYTNQVKQEVDKNFFEIKHLKEYWTKLEKYKKEKKIIALDESLHSINEVTKLEEIFKFSKCSLSFLESNPIDFFWKDQPKFPNSLAFLHEEKYAGDKTINKIKKIQYKIKQASIDYYLLNTLDSIAWLLNIRGNDINYTPLICCYVIIPKTGKVELFIEKKKIKKIINRIDKYVNVNSFKSFKLFINKIKIQKTIGIDKKESPYLFKKICKGIGLKIHYLENPCLYLKAKKNLVEIEGAKKANIRDGVTISKFLYWSNKSKHKDVEYVLDTAPELNKLIGSGQKFEVILMSAFIFHFDKSARKKIFKAMQQVAAENCLFYVSVRSPNNSSGRSFYEVKREEIETFAKEGNFDFRPLGQTHDKLARNAVSWQHYILNR